MIDPRRESAVGCGLVGGLALVVIGVLLTVALLGGGAGRMAQSQGSDVRSIGFAVIGILVALGGVVLFVASLVGGLKTSRGATRNTNVRIEPEARIVARFILGPTNEPVYDPEVFDPAELTYMVRVELPGGRRAEFRCAKDLHDGLGEGMRGTIRFQGDWLGQFVPTFGPTERDE